MGEKHVLGLPASCAANSKSSIGALPRALSATHVAHVCACASIVERLNASPSSTQPVLYAMVATPGDEPSHRGALSARTNASSHIQHPPATTPAPPAQT